MKRSSSDSSNDANSLFFGAEPEPNEAQDDANEKAAKKRAPRKSKKTTRASESEDASQVQPSFGALFESNPLFVNQASPEEAQAPESSEAKPEVVEAPAEETVDLSEPSAPVDEQTAQEGEPIAECAPEPIVDAQEEEAPLSEPIVEKTESVEPVEPAPPEPAEQPAPTPPTPRVESERVPAPVKKASAYQVVARRYRPQTFGELIGQETAARALTNAIASDRVGHAYLFTGARGVGKTSCARIFAKALNCVHGPTTTPCLKCESCVSIASGEDVDVLEIDGASNRGVDEIRQLRQNAAVAPSRSLYKIYIIDEVHMLTREAFNALLKTLEEPPERVKFIFCTTEPNKLPITILSRCQRFDFNSIGGDSISARLAQIASQEGAQAEPGVFDVLARRANGSMRDAQSLLEQLLSFAPNYISLADVRNMIGSVDDKTIFDILDATIEGNAARVFETLSLAAKHGVDFGALLEQILGYYRDLMVVSSGCGASELLYSPMGRYQDLQRIAETFGVKRILASLQILDQTAQRMRFSAQTRVLVEIALARLCRLDSLQALETLITQLKRGAFPQVPFPTPLPSESPDANSGDQKKNRNSVASAEVEPPPRPVVERAPVAPPPPEPPIAPPVAPRAAAQPASEASYEWLNFSPDDLAAVWSDATNVGVILPAKAQKFAKIVAEKPRNFVVVFSASNGDARDYCEGEREKIRARLEELLSSKVDLRVIVDPSIKETPPPESNAPVRETRAQDRRPDPRTNYRELFRKVAESEIARQIEDVFGAELADVKAPIPPRRDNP